MTRITKKGNAQLNDVACDEASCRCVVALSEIRDRRVDGKCSRHHQKMTDTRMKRSLLRPFVSISSGAVPMMLLKLLFGDVYKMAVVRLL